MEGWEKATNVLISIYLTPRVDPRMDGCRECALNLMVYKDQGHSVVFISGGKTTSWWHFLAWIGACRSPRWLLGSKDPFSSGGDTLDLL